MEYVNRLLCGDCIEIMKSMESNSIDLIVTSPPYNLRQSTGNGMKNGSGGLWQNAALLDGYTESTDDLPYKEYVEWQRECLSEMMRLIPDNGAIFYNHKWRVQGGLIQDRREIVKDFPVRQIIIWQRSGGINFNLQYFLPTYEVIYLICKPKFRLHSKDPSRPKAACGVGDVWKIKQARSKHPAAFPVELPKRCIGSTNAKIVLDPFMGSGTTAIAAMELGIDWIGVDNSKEYCQMAEQRISSYMQQEPVAGNK